MAKDTAFWPFRPTPRCYEMTKTVLRAEAARHGAAIEIARDQDQRGVRQTEFLCRASGVDDGGQCAAIGKPQESARQGLLRGGEMCRQLDSNPIELDPGRSCLPTASQIWLEGAEYHFQRNPYAFV